jgi:hypothetical protein
VTPSCAATSEVDNSLFEPFCTALNYHKNLVVEKVFMYKVMPAKKTRDEIATTVRRGYGL